jgi:hypothetical protein
MLLYYLLFASGNNITWVIEDAYQMYHILNIAMTRRMTTLLSAWSKYNIKKKRRIHSLVSRDDGDGRVHVHAWPHSFLSFFSHERL